MLKSLGYARNNVVEKAGGRAGGGTDGPTDGRMNGPTNETRACNGYTAISSREV